jgi:hypothetical protein
MTSTRADCRKSTRFEFAAGQTVSIALEPDSHRGKPRVVSACLLDLSSHGAKLAVSIPLPKNKSLRVKLTLEQLAMEFYVSAKVCWTAHEDETGSVIGCQFCPRLPDELLGHFAAGSLRNQRKRDRKKCGATIKILREQSAYCEVETAILQNHSAGGFCIETKQPAVPGEKLLIVSESAEQAVTIAVIHWQLQRQDKYLQGCAYVGKARLDSRPPPRDARARA